MLFQEKRIRNFVESVELALENENWYAALTLAVTLPDICTRLDGTKIGNESAKPYIKWFDKYVGEDYAIRFTKNDNTKEEIVYINGNNAYALRCSFLHDGSGNIDSQRAWDKDLNVDNVIFCIPSKNNNDGIKTAFSGSFLGRELVLSVEEYCLSILNGITNWIKDCKEENRFTEHIEKVIEIKTVDEIRKMKLNN